MATSDFFNWFWPGLSCLQFIVILHLYGLLRALPALPSDRLGHLEGDPQRQVDADGPGRAPGYVQYDHVFGISRRAAVEFLEEEQKKGELWTKGKLRLFQDYRVLVPRC